MRTPTLAQVTAAFRRKVQRDLGLERGTLRFDFGDAGSVFIDGNQHPNDVANKDTEADCTVYTTLGIVYSLILGQIDGVRAVEAGHLTIAGDVRQAMAFGPAEGDLPTTPFIESNLRFPFTKPRSKKTKLPSKRSKSKK